MRILLIILKLLFVLDVNNITINHINNFIRKFPDSHVIFIIACNIINQIEYYHKLYTHSYYVTTATNSYNNKKKNHVKIISLIN